jgi:hypothetical protein
MHDGAKTKDSAGLTVLDPVGVTDLGRLGPARLRVALGYQTVGAFEPIHVGPDNAAA